MTNSCVVQSIIDVQEANFFFESPSQFDGKSQTYVCLFVVSETDNSNILGENICILPVYVL